MYTRNKRILNDLSLKIFFIEFLDLLLFPHIVILIIFNLYELHSYTKLPCLMINKIINFYLAEELNISVLTLAIVSSFLLGIFIINYLTTHPLKMARSLLISSFLFFLIIIFSINSFVQNFVEGISLIGGTILAFFLGYYVRATKIIFFSVTISADAIHSQYDIPQLVYKAEIPKDIDLIDLGAWNNHPMVIEAIKECIDRYNPWKVALKE